MYKIATLNKISPIGLNIFDDKYQLIDELDEAHGILVRSHNMKDMEFSKNLLAIARAGAGTNNIPVDKCAEEGIVVFNTPGANAHAVKELVIAAILMGARNLPASMSWVKTLNADVAAQVEKGKSKFQGVEIYGKTLGVVGLGAIGVLVANTAQRLGMKVVGYDPYITLKSAHELSNKIEVTKDLSNLLSKCDFVSLHVPATPDTAGMMDQRRFAQIKKGSILLNFSRDKLVNENALLEALEAEQITQYITDFPNDKIAGKDGVILIPHLGASTIEAEDSCASMAAEELMDYIENGNIKNSVNFPNCDLGPLNPDALARVCILNKNVPSMLGKITGILADLNVNIRDLTNKSKDDYACTLLDIDSNVNPVEFKKALDIDGIIRIRFIEKNKTSI